MKGQTRRSFIKKTTLSAAMFPLMSFPLNEFIGENHVVNGSLSVNIFSKHLQFLDCKTAAEMANEMGFEGIDLTVRPNGHVDPSKVSIELPEAISAINDGGSKCHIITTSIESANNPIDLDILKTAASLGIKYYRTNWFKYNNELSMPETLQVYQDEIRKLGEINKELRIIGCYQNHAGKNVGSSFWEIKEILQTSDPEYFGTQYDIRHAMVEGGYSWENGLKLLHPKIKMIVLKDFKWGIVNGKWEARNVPIGEGMVNFTKYFKLLKYYKLNPPVSLHLEYDLGGAEKGNKEITIDKKIVLDHMKRDLKRVQKLWYDA